jgi:cytolethal distending toxin subunit B
MNIVTWNMQGANADTENKWNTQVANMLNSIAKPEFICLQECGGIPPSAVPIGESEPVEDPYKREPTRAVYYAWHGTESRPGCGVAYHQWDGGRVNTAVVIRNLVQPMPPMRLVWGGQREWRPAVGVEVEGRWIFSFHAISPGGADAAVVTAAVAAAAASVAPKPWLIGGDFNREPDPGFAVPAGSSIREPDGSTYKVGDPKKKYDYCVSTEAPGGPGQVLDLVVFSDHFPVLFQF